MTTATVLRGREGGVGQNETIVLIGCVIVTETRWSGGIKNPKTFADVI